MAKKEDRGNEMTGLTETPAPESTKMKIRWDSSNMRSAYANVFNVAKSLVIVETGALVFTHML